MSKTTNYSYVGIAAIVLIFGIIFIPKIVNRVSNDDITRSESRSEKVDTQLEETRNHSDLSFIKLTNEEGETYKKKAPSFSFKNQNGKLITNNDYLGKVYVVEFFFTTCPTICPRMSRNLVDVQDKFKGIDDFGIASFTINPDYDTQEILKSYADNYGVTNPNWHFMTGNQKEIMDLANIGFTIYAGKDNEAEGGFAHSGNFALVDKNGYLRSRTDEYGNPKIYYKGIISEAEGEEDGEIEEISILKEDIAKLLRE